MRGFKSVVFFGCLLLALLYVTDLTAQPREHLLDLLSVPSAAGVLLPPEEGRVPVDQQLIGGSQVLAPHQPLPRSPFALRLQLVSLDRLSYAAGESMIYEVRLTNTGRAPLWFPWSVDPSPFRVTSADSRFATLGLKEADTNGDRGEIGRIFLYGSSDVPGSLEEVGAGETIRIRVRLEWMLHAQRATRLRAVLVPTAAHVAYPPIESANAILVQSRGREK